MKKSINPEFDALIDCIFESGEIARKYFQENQAGSHILKSDNSPLTQADLEINKLLCEKISQLFPTAKIISEENDAAQNLAALVSERVFIIDPIDGTDAFIKGSSEFSVNIALKVGEKLDMGMIYLPIEDVLYYADSKVGAFKINGEKVEKLEVKNDFSKKITVLATRRQDEFAEIKTMLGKLADEVDFLNIASSIKFCYLCDGRADAYYRAARIKIWDVAAGFALVKFCGFKIEDDRGNDLLKLILKKDYLNEAAKNEFRIEPFVIKNERL